MKTPRVVLLVCSLLPLLGGCKSTPQEVDLAHNPKICGDLPFVTRAPGDRAVFVAPVVDSRHGALPAHDRGFPISYGPDAAWDRPVPDMVGELFERELGESGLFSQVSSSATPEAVVIQPELVSFSMGTMENIQGARTFAEVALKLRVFGPEGAAGERPLWFERVYGDRQVTEPQIKPANMFLLAGSTTMRSLAKVFSALDGTNVGRSGVPLVLGEPSTPSASATVARAAEGALKLGL
ncbi:MAG: hypothetical protein KDC48_22610 [Planctomycetes bacterium]|nr:hypothetical protein [Planctomycetota bacterium]